MILVEVYVPAADEKFDFELDENVKIDQIITELGEMLSKKMKSPMVKSTDQFMLCLMGRDEILQRDRTLYQSHVKDGSRLLLV